jgi:hypothetical protein
MVSGQLANTPGIVLSIESNKIREANLTMPWNTGQPTFNQRAGTRRSRAVLFLPKQQDRQQMLVFATSGLLKDQFDTLCNTTLQISKCIGRLMTTSAYIDGDLYKCHHALCPFFRSCGKQIFPAIHFAPKAIWDSLDDFLVTGNIDTTVIELIASSSPTLAGFFAYLYTIECDEQKQNVSVVISL